MQTVGAVASHTHSFVHLIQRAFGSTGMLVQSKLSVQAVLRHLK